MIPFILLIFLFSVYANTSKNTHICYYDKGNIFSATSASINEKSEEQFHGKKKHLRVVVCSIHFTTLVYLSTMTHAQRERDRERILYYPLCIFAICV